MRAPSERFHRRLTLVLGVAGVLADLFFVAYRSLAHLGDFVYFPALDWLPDVAFPFGGVQLGLALLKGGMIRQHRIWAAVLAHFIVLQMLMTAKFAIPLVYPSRSATGSTFDIQDLAVYTLAVAASLSIHGLFYYFDSLAIHPMHFKTPELQSA